MNLTQLSTKTVSLLATNAESAPTAPSTQGIYCRGFEAACIAVKCATHTDFSLTLYASNDGVNVFKVRNGEFTSQTNFCDVIDIRGVTHIFPIISATSGAGTEEYHIYVNLFKSQ